MWMKAGVLEGIKFSNLPPWTWAALSIALACYSFFKPRGENDNGINRLPDDILGNIVSRLFASEASRTSILSKRWRKIWTMKSELNLWCIHELNNAESYHLDPPYGDRQRFFNAVNQCLKVYSGRKLKMFFVHCCFMIHHSCNLLRWMQSIARLDVEELCLGQSCYTSCHTPFHLKFTFSFKIIDGLSKLRRLVLVASFVETSFVSQCNSLVSITFKEVPLDMHKLFDILMFCPNLRILCFQICISPENLRISGKNLKLKVFEMHDCHNVKTLNISDCNLVTILLDIHDSELKISMSSLPKLETMHLQIHVNEFCFGDVLRDLPQLRLLSVQAKLQILWLPPTFKVFGNVRILYLLTKCYRNEKPFKEVDIWNFALVLTACPLLEEFYLSVGGPFCKEVKNEPQHQLRHKHLEHMELSGFSDTQDELEFAKFILTSAEVLRLLQLRPSFRMCDGRRYFFVGEKDIIQEGAQVVCAELQGHAISMRARVEMC